MRPEATILPSDPTTTHDAATETTSGATLCALRLVDHWYPAAWTRDLPVDACPVTLFDVDYCVVNRGKREPLALEDRCPHRLAALSEGQPRPWAAPAPTMAGASTRPANAGPSQREVGASTALCATAVDDRVEQGLLWLACRAAPISPRRSTEAPPPRVPEMDDPAFKWTTAIRVPVDYSILVENMRAEDRHVLTGGKPFDLYTRLPRRAATVFVDESSPGFCPSRRPSPTPKW